VESTGGSTLTFAHAGDNALTASVFVLILLPHKAIFIFTLHSLAIGFAEEQTGTG
jgi:hypothetical protein